MSCENCRVLQSKLDRIRAILDEATATKPLFTSELGRLLAATASAKGLTLAAVSLEAGYAKDYASRIARGKLALNARAASLIGNVLGLDLSAYIVATKRAPRKAKEQPGSTAEPLPFKPGVGVAS